MHKSITSKASYKPPTLESLFLFYFPSILLSLFPLNFFSALFFTFLGLIKPPQSWNVRWYYGEIIR